MVDLYIGLAFLFNDNENSISDYKILQKFKNNLKKA